MKRIVNLTRPNGSTTTDEDEAKLEAIRYYQTLLGSAGSNCYPGIQELRKVISKSICPTIVDSMESIPTDQDIKDTLFSFHSNQAPRPDGFNAHFFKETWGSTGACFTAAVKEFFLYGELLRETNATLIALIPKVPNPSSMGDFRPISCCNTVYKCISKIIAKRIHNTLPRLVDHAQSAFIKGRKISDNILLAQDLMRDYHKSSGTPRASAKIDLMKAYDSVSWVFLFDLLEVLGFPSKFITWVRACVTSPTYSICFNGESVGYFPGARGLRQGDPLSPYLFVLDMDALSQMLHFNISNSKDFKYHWRCEKTKIDHLCFADNLLLFFHGDSRSAGIISVTLQQFYDFSGLSANCSKSCLFMAGVAEEEGDSIKQILQFPIGSLPMRYLGVLLVTTRLKKSDCFELSKKITNKIQSWTSKLLSYAGRVQLVNSVLMGIHNFWAGMFILPKGILKDIEKVIRRFLWSGDVEKSYGSKVAWDKVCLPKEEGGLGLKPLAQMNFVQNLKHIWHLLSPSTESLWKTWIQVYMLKGKSFWSVNPPSHCSWYWRKLLKLRTVAKGLVKYKIGNGNDTFLWHDP